MPMQIKTFRARTLRDALAMVRAEFGTGAAVLHSREVNTGPIARLVRGTAIEVAATPEHYPLAEQAAKSGAVATAPIPNRVAPRLAELGVAVDRLSNRTAVADRDKPSEESLSAYAGLLEADFAPGLARDLVQSADQASGSSDPIFHELEQRLSDCRPIRCQPGARRVVALVGATGVGKTTTLAKLAANFRLREKVRVGVVTVDTYRVAAVEQLRTYSEIIDLPMEVVATPAEMRTALEKLADVDLVLIDTAGRSPRDEAHLEELRLLLAEATPDETHLVLSTTATARGIQESIDRFGVVAPTSLLLTKIDEAPTLGHVAEPLFAAGLPVSYLTNGQRVPEDIGVAHPRTLTTSLLSSSLEAA